MIFIYIYNDTINYRIYIYLLIQHNKKPRYAAVVMIRKFPLLWYIGCGYLWSRLGNSVISKNYLKEKFQLNKFDRIEYYVIPANFRSKPAGATAATAEAWLQ